MDMNSAWQLSFSLGRYRSEVDASVARMIGQGVPERIWRKDHTLWSSSPTEITNRLGWLHSPRAMAACFAPINTLVDTVRREGYTQALLLGMGGSSLAPAVFRRTFGAADGYPDLSVLDSTDPDAVLGFSEKLDWMKTLFIVSTKSGGTIETFSFMKYFFNLLSERYGIRQAGRNFIAITDPGSALAEIAALQGFRAVFLNDPDIGGRYSALSHFGLLPAALIGANVSVLLERAADAAAADGTPGMQNTAAGSGLYLGAVMGELARGGRDKLTFVFSPQIAGFGDWLEQLIAESTGKQGRGILPVMGEPLGPADLYGDDRVFVWLRLAGDTTRQDDLEGLERAGHPVIRITLGDIYGLSGQMFLWEMATAVAGHILGINPFDQPDVEAAKALARSMMAGYRESGSLPRETPALAVDGTDVYGECSARSPGEALHLFLQSARPNAYIALQAYLPPTVATHQALMDLRTALRDRYRLATTVGYGPGYLHSTGQLHKGDAGFGMFVQLTTDDRRDVPIPDEMGHPGASVTFGVLKAAQALGDRQALLQAGRKVIRFHFSGGIARGIKLLTQA
jgi:glucose-6-phosphate isomerase